MPMAIAEAINIAIGREWVNSRIAATGTATKSQFKRFSGANSFLVIMSESNCFTVGIRLGLVFVLDKSFYLIRHFGCYLDVLTVLAGSAA